MTTLSMSELTKGKHSISMLTGRLRWNAGVLEQQWAFQTYEDGSVAAQHEEWHPVPDAGSEETK